MAKKILNTWNPLVCTASDNKVDIDIWGRHYTTENNILFSSVNVLDDEILSAPIRIVAKENGKDIEWTEVVNFVLSKDDEKAVICGSMRGDYITADTVSTVEFDGYTHIALTVMPRTFTLYEEKHFGTQPSSDWSLDRLWLEIPLKKKYAKNFHYFPNRDGCPTPTFEGKSIPANRVASSREIPSSMAMPFMPILYVGDETRGFCFDSDHNKNWQPEDINRAMEIIDGEEEVIVRLHLADSLPKAWLRPDGSPRKSAAPPLTFGFNFQFTPVKPFPENPYKEKILHIDCFNGKILEEYNDYLKSEFIKGSGEICYDRMKRLGVTTLIIHEKWNPVQNWWVIGDETRERTMEIVNECHSRGIKVIPYFGYELSTLSPLWEEKNREWINMYAPNSIQDFSWYRKPNQRARRMCPQSDFSDEMCRGVKKVIEEFDFDGIYIDTLCIPFGCYNEGHGCSFVDVFGNIQPTYPISKVRAFCKSIFEFIEERGGCFNPHISSCCNIPAYSFCHLQWDGEDVQWYVANQGDDSIDCLTPDYIRTEYIGRNFGLPHELIAYTFPNWSFEDSMTIALVHGILPRPNFIGEPLELMSPIWKAIDDFGIEGSEFKPYWLTNIDCGNEKTQVTYYEKDGKRLAFISNMSNVDNNNINLTIGNSVTDALTGEKITMPMSLSARKHKVLLIND